MIAHLSGTVTEKFALSSIIIDVNGIGYEVSVTTLDYEQLKLDTVVKVYTFHHVREQEESLFGFTSLEGKRLFELLITVQGIGPKAAMSILSLAPPEEIRSAISNEDDGYISKASGVGKKSASRVIVDLKDKVGLPTKAYGRTVTSPIIEKDEALEALMALGYNLNDASLALEKVDKNLPLEDRIRKALSH